MTPNQSHSHSLRAENRVQEPTSQQLEQLRRQHQLILNAVGEGVYGLDLDGNVTFVNPAAAAMIDWPMEDLIGKSMHKVLHHSHPDGSHYPREDCPIYAAFQDGSVRRITNEVFWRKDGTSFPVEYISTPMHDEEGQADWRGGHLSGHHQTPLGRGGAAAHQRGTGAKGAGAHR
jgi:PAS domain S-box-containing protein